MLGRMLLAGVLGGIALFLWGSLAHIILEVGNVGIKEIPQEELVVSAMRANIHEPGFYFFPGIGLPPGATDAQKDAAQSRYEQRYAAGPNGVLIYHPKGTKLLSLNQVAIELALNIAQALLAAWLLSLATLIQGYWKRVGFVTMIGALAAITTNIEYWNWYGFPGKYTAAATLDKMIGFFLAGVVVAGVMTLNLKRKAQAA